MRGIFGLALIFITVLPAPTLAAFFPPFAIGNSFSGTFSIDPNTPVNSFSDSTHFNYSGPTLGTFAVTINGNTFSEAVDVVSVTPGSDNQTRWFLSTCCATALFNGQPIQSLVADIILYGSTNSTSILPLPLSNYAPVGSYLDDPGFLSGPNFQMNAVAPDGKSGVALQGPLESLVAIDSEGDFTFAGTLGVAVAFTIPAAVPESSTWAMLLIGFAAIGLVSLRKPRRETFTTVPTRQPKSPHYRYRINLL